MIFFLPHLKYDSLLCFFLSLFPVLIFFCSLGSVIKFHNQIWASQLLSMYTKWAKKQGYKGRVVEKRSSMNGGIKLATIEFEFKFAYGYLSGEMGVHNMIRGSQVGSLYTSYGLHS